MHGAAGSASGPPGAHTPCTAVASQKQMIRFSSWKTLASSGFIKFPFRLSGRNKEHKTLAVCRSLPGTCSRHPPVLHVAQKFRNVLHSDTCLVRLLPSSCRRSMNWVSLRSPIASRSLNLMTLSQASSVPSFTGVWLFSPLPP